MVILREQLSLKSKQLVDEFKMDRWIDGWDVEEQTVYCLLYTLPGRE